MKIKSLASYFFLALMVAFVMAATEAVSATRDLVFEEEDETEAVAKAAEAGIKNPEVISVKTTFDLTTKDGETASVPANYEFSSGEKLKLRYTTNTDGYAYWLAKMSSGKYAILFPSKEAGSNNFVKKNENQTVPLTGYFRFDENPGKESLLLVFSKEKVAELEEAVTKAMAENTTTEQDIPQIASLELNKSQKSKTRDLVFEEEDEEEVSTKTQAGTAGDPFIAYYELIHK
jgi:hypothetical protein